MKKIIFISTFCSAVIIANAQQNLNGVTFGFALGYRVLQKDTYDYSLSPDANHNLEQQGLSKGSFVLSSVISVKLSDLSVGTSGANKSKLLRQSDKQPVTVFNRFSVNAAFNLAELQSTGIAFNKTIDGGLGIGYFITSNVQLGIFYDFQTIRQLRDYITNNYLNKPIPNGTGFYNALDINDNNLFYNKTITGFSFKIIISVGNHK